MSIDRYTVALHQAAHTAMAYLKRSPVIELMISDRPNGRKPFGICNYEEPKHWLDEVWITLAGPIAVAIFEGSDGLFTITGYENSDYHHAIETCQNLVLDKVPSSLLPYIPANANINFFESIVAGFYDCGLKGQMKRELKRYAKHYCKAYQFACEMVLRQMKAVRQFIENNSSFMEFAHVLAAELDSACYMNQDDLYAFCKTLGTQSEGGNENAPQAAA